MAAPHIRIDSSKINLNEAYQDSQIPTAKISAKTQANPKIQDRLSPARENKIAEKMYRAMFYIKDPRVKKLELTDLGKQLLTLTGIKQDTIMRRDLAYFERQFPEADIAALHYGHYCKRREKNLMKLQEQYKISMMAER